VRPGYTPVRVHASTWTGHRITRAPSGRGVRIKMKIEDGKA